jgi:hypothetical protein
VIAADGDHIVTHLSWKISSSGRGGVNAAGFRHFTAPNITP